MEINKNDSKIAKAINNFFTDEEIAVIKNTVAKKTTNTELAYFIFVSSRLQLDPLNKEVWCYKDSQSNLLVFAGRDGFLSKAQKSPKWNGILSSEVRSKDDFKLNIPEGKVEHIKNVMDKGDIVGAYAICKPKGCELATVEWVDFDVYNRNYGAWKTHPADMIKKVAELHALKKAYGVSGLQSEYDYEIRNETAYPINTEQLDTEKISHIHYLLQSSSIGEQEVIEVENEIANSKISNTRLDEIIQYLKSNQLDLVEQGQSYSQTDIHEKLDSIDKDEKK